MNIAILTTSDQWFENYAKTLALKLRNATIYNNHIGIKEKYDIVFILSYHRVLDEGFLKNNKHNIVIHESYLPQGKGWAPLFWQILEGKSSIPFTMFEATIGVDNGDILMRDQLNLTGYELNEEIREKQAQKIMQMCKNFIQDYDQYKEGKKQEGVESFYPKRTEKDSRLDVEKTIKEQFNILRVTNNKEYPAYFELDGHRYLLNIKLDKHGF